MIKIIAIGMVAAVTTLDAHILTFTTRPDKKVFGSFEPIEVTSELRVSANSERQAYPEGISGNVVYEVEYELRGAFLPLKQNRQACGPPLWGAKVQDLTIDNAPLIGTMDLRMLFGFKAGRYRVRGKYRSDSHSSTFEKESDWAEFEIQPPTKREAIIFEECLQTAGVGNTDAEKWASYEAFAAKYPTDYITARVYSEILHFYLKTGDRERALDFLKKVINNPNISKLKRRLFAYELGGLEEKSGRVDEAIQWYRQSGLRNGEARIKELQQLAN